MPRRLFAWVLLVWCCATLAACRTEPYPATALQRDGGADLRTLDLASPESSGNIGDPCTLPGNVFGRGTCSSDKMICEQSGFPGGYCSQPCKSDFDTTCPEGAACFFVSPGVHRCMKQCDFERDCRDGYTCDLRGYCERSFDD